MSAAAKTIFYFGIYVIFLGLTLLAAPGLPLALFRDQTEDVVWLRVLGLVVAILGFYYIQAARHELKPFFQATVYARPVVILVFIVMVLFRLGKPYMILFGLGDLLGALWTGLALRGSEARANENGV